MTYETYLNSCLKFSADSREWGALDPSHFYTTDGYGELYADAGHWTETPDGDGGGLDVSWAFHLDADAIRSECPARYAWEIVNGCRCCLDNAVDPDTFYSYLDNFTL